MKPKAQFAEYNKENILGNLLQAETHYKNLTESTDPEFAACINKHLLEAQMELSELQAHDNKNQDAYKDIMMNLRKIRKDNLKGLTSEDGISRIRKVRGRFEQYVEGHNTEFCQSCGTMDNTIKRIMNRAKHLNTSTDQKNKQEEKIMDSNVTQALIGNFAGKGVRTAVPMVVTGTTAGIENKTLANLGFGAALTGLALYGKIPGRFELAGAVAGGNMIAEEVVDLIMGYMPTETTRARAVARAPTRTRTPPQGASADLYRTTIGTSAGKNGQLVYID